MADGYAALLNSLPIAAAAWAGAASLGYMTLLPGSLPALRYWTPGFLLLGLGLALSHMHGHDHLGGGIPAGEHIGLAEISSIGDLHSAGIAITLVAICLIGQGLLNQFKSPISRRTIAIVAGVILVLALGTAVFPVLRVVLTPALHGTSAFVALGLSIFCIHKRRTLKGHGLRFLSFAFFLFALDPLFFHLSLPAEQGALVVTSIIVFSTVSLAVGLSIVVMREQQILAAQTSERLRWTEQRYELAMKGGTDGIWDWDFSTNMILLTSQLKAMAGITSTETHFPAETMVEYVHPDDEAAYLEAIADLIRGNKPSLYIEFRMIPGGRSKKDGQEVWVVNRGCIIRDDTGWATRMAGTIIDITERKLFERQLIDAKEEAELASRSKSEFLANMSHELRTPLNAIIGFTDIMKQKVFGPIGNDRYVEYTDSVNMAGRHLLQLISDIIDMAKIESGQIQLDEEPCDVGEIIDGCVQLVTSRVQEESLFLDVSLSEDLPKIHGDAIRIKQILLNLLTNSAKFTPAGGRITLSAALTENGEIRFTVADTGIGIAKKDIPKALSRFGRLGSPYVRSRDGMGLGLALVQMFADLHGASFTLESTVGEGTTVTVLFPADRTVKA